jgi:S1-C subfamily serine protease
VLKLKESVNLPHVIDLGSSSNLQVGEPVLAVGVKYGLFDTVSVGVVTRLGRFQSSTFKHSDGRRNYNKVDSSRRTMTETYLEVDAVINNVNAGGPLLNSLGQTIGLIVYNAPSSSHSSASSTSGYVIPIDTVKTVVSSLISNKSIGNENLKLTFVEHYITQLIAVKMGQAIDGILLSSVLPDDYARIVGM